MAEGLTKSTVLIHPELIDRENMERLMPGVWQIEKEAKVAHRHVPMSAWIVALSRKTTGAGGTISGFAGAGLSF